MHNPLDISSAMNLASFYYGKKMDSKVAYYSGIAKKIIENDFPKKSLSREELRDKLTIVVRTVNERTTGVCVGLISNLISLPNIIIVNETPFSHAVRKGFERALEAGREWTLIIDADVLIRSNFIYEILQYACLLEQDVFLIQGLVHDKFLGSFRPAGNHLYRTEHLGRALQVIPEEGVTLRPENSTMRNMVQLGYKFVQTPYIAGLHDYEQDYFDIAKKCFLHAHKHAHFLEILFENWSKMAEWDADYQAALLGFTCGLNHKGDVYVDSDFIMGKLNLSLESGLPQKERLKADSYSDDEVRHALMQSLEKTCINELQFYHYFPREWWLFLSRAAKYQGEQNKNMFKKEAAGCIAGEK